MNALLDNAFGGVALSDIMRRVQQCILICGWMIEPEPASTLRVSDGMPVPNRRRAY